MQEIRLYQVTKTDFRRMHIDSSDLSYSDTICVQCLTYLFSKILLGLLPNSNMTPQVSQKPSKLGRGLRTHFVCVHAPTGKPDPSCCRACSSQDASLNYCQGILTDTQNRDMWDQPVWEKLITLSRPPAVVFFFWLLTFCILIQQASLAERIELTIKINCQMAQHLC